MFNLQLQKYKANAVVKPREITIKTERDIESSIKREFQSVDQSMVSTSAPNTQNGEQSWIEEKKMLINKIVSLKAENKKNALDLKSSKDELKKLIEEIKTKDKIHSKEMDKMQSKLSALNEACEKLKTESGKRIPALVKDNKLLQARFNQLQNAISQQESANECKENDEEFCEVDRLIAHKIIEKRTYLVRWKGFGSKDDSWVEESNLQCPAVLKKYKQSKRLN